MKKFVIAIAVVVMAAFAVPAFAAMNPFMDVPASHWAYDAVAQLAARGVISGYPDGTYKGAQPTTRYEMASALARALAKVDMEKASKQDVEMLKKLIVEFKDELDALGVKVDQLDERVAVLENDLGGWSMAGQLRFDANFGGDEGFYGARGENDFELNRFRLFVRNRINETTTFEARIGAAGQTNDQSDKAMRWELFSVTTKLGYDISLTVGRSTLDWEGDLGLYGGNDAYVGDMRLDMFRFKKDWGMANLELVFGREEGEEGEEGGYRFGDSYLPDPVKDLGLEQFLIAGLANFNITEKFRAGLMGYYWFTDEEVAGSDTDLLDLGIYAGYAFTPGIELKGIYYYQDQGDSWSTEDDASAWKVILDVDQDVLKFTSVWLEYGQIDNNFARLTGLSYGSFGDTSAEGADLLMPRSLGLDADGSTKVYGIRANQQWNDKWRTFVRYFAADYDTAGFDDAAAYGIGLGYRLNPAVEFELAYDAIDYDDLGDDNMIRFRTFVTF